MTEDIQLEVCSKNGSKFVPPTAGSMVGVSKNLFEKKAPINGLRRKPEGQGNGWFLWTGGDIPTDPDYFRPMHIEHIYEQFPEISRYLGLGPGYRFQVDLKGYEDVWFDDRLIGNNGR